MNTTHKMMRIITGAMLSGGFAVAGSVLGAGTAHAGAYHWCPGDPSPQVNVIAPNGNTVSITIQPAWDTSVCHVWVPSGNHVREGIPCISLLCPPGTMRENQMPIIPNVGES